MIPVTIQISMNHYDITAMGELIIDFTKLPDSPSGNMIFEGYAGGGAANALASATAMGCSAAFVGGTGNDLFGMFLIKTLKKLGIETKGVYLFDEKPTGIGFVSLDDAGERSFLFYRDPSIKISLINENAWEILSSTSLLHLTSVSMTNETTRKACLCAMNQVKKSGGRISYDINYRKALWKSEVKAHSTIREALRLSDIIKLSETEAETFFPGMNHDTLFDSLHGLGASMVFLTLGAKGCRFSFSGGRGFREPIPVKAVDTTGSGDAFYGTVLALLVQAGRIEDLTVDQVFHIVDAGNTAGALCAQQYGSLTVMPSRNEVEQALRKRT